MGWPRRSRDTREQHTLHMERRTDESYPPYHVGPAERRERTDSYWTLFIVGLISPFVLAVPLYPLAWWPVWAVIVPVAGLLWAALVAVLSFFGGASDTQNPLPPPGGPLWWDIGPMPSPQVVLACALSFALAWFVLSRMAGGRYRLYDPGLATRGFRAGLRLSCLVAFILFIWWADRVLAVVAS